MQSFYEILDISDTSEEKEIEEAYRRQCKAYHPDKVGHLGKEFQALASAKMVLINDAYRVLRDPDNRQRYKGDPAAYHGVGFFTICRSCGYSTWVSEASYLKTKSCPLCGREYNRNLMGPGRVLWGDISPILFFLQLSHDHFGKNELASSLQVLAGKTPVTLDRMPDNRWCLLTQSHVLHSRWLTLASAFVQEWDNACDAAFCIVPPAGLNKDSQELLRLIHVLDGGTLPSAALMPGERRGVQADPNLLLISALSDRSISRSRSIWKSSGGNLFACEFDLEAGWEPRMEEMFDIAYNPKREVSSLSRIKWEQAGSRVRALSGKLETMEETLKIIKEEVLELADIFAPEKSASDVDRSSPNA